MSWIIQNLLRDSVNIRTRSDIESDSYNDLIILESKIKSLYDSGIISDKEMRIINYVADGSLISHSNTSFSRNAKSISKDFVRLCKKIAFYIGDYFTDDGYLFYMKKRYNLSDEQIDELIEYMNHGFRYKLIRRKK